MLKKVLILALSGLLLTNCSEKNILNSLPSVEEDVEEAIDLLKQNGALGSGGAIDSGLTEQVLLFQANWTSKEINYDGGTVNQQGIAHNYSYGIYADPNDGDKIKMLVNDRDNNRILIFNNVPLSSGTLPDVVVGQPNFTSTGAHAGQASTNQSGYNSSIHVTACPDGKMFVTDRNNHRILGYNQIPKTNGVTADFVIGQSDFTSNSSGTSATQLNSPYAAGCAGDKLLVLDRGNHRILVYNTIPSSSNPTPDFVIGQNDFVSGSSQCTGSGLNTPYEMLYDDGKLYVADGGNHRVIVFNSFPSTSGAAADVVIGQADLTSCQKNRDNSTTVTQTGLYFPNSLAVRDSKLAVGDHSNNRILFYDLPLTTDEAPTHVLGQPDFTSNAITDPPDANTFTSVKGLVFDGSYIWVGDTTNKRIGAFPLPF